MRFFMQAILCVVLAFSLSSCALVQRIEDNFSKERPKISFESPLKVFTKELSEDTLLAHETLSFVSIDETSVSVTVDSTKHDKELANKIMRLVQAEFETSMSISVKFQK